MDVRDLVNVDLNLLVFLHILLEEKHVTRAAKRMGASQPAASRALAKLRELFDDPLLVRSGSTFALTERARDLQPKLTQILMGIRTMTQSTLFDPSESSGVFRIAAPDIISYMLVPPLMAKLSELAPKQNIEIVHWQMDWRSRLEHGDIDLTIGFPVGTETNIYAQNLFEFDWAVMLHKNNHVLKKKWSAECYSSLQHVVVSMTGGPAGAFDEILRRQNLNRRVSVRVPYPMLAPMLIQDNQLVVTTNKWLAMKLSSAFECIVRPLPFEVPSVKVPIVWHERTHNDPRHKWVRQLLLGVASEIDTRLLRW